MKKVTRTHRKSKQKRKDLQSNASSSNANKSLLLDSSSPSLGGPPTTTSRQKHSSTFVGSRASSFFPGNHSSVKFARGLGSIPVQKAGFLSKKPFYSKNLLGSWSKHYFVLKDGFLLWYKKKPGGDNNFGIHPTGFVPLSSCSVIPEGKYGNGWVFVVRSVDFKGKDLLLKADTQDEAIEWSRLLTEATKVTIDNAQLGEAQMLLLESKDKRREDERLRLMEASRKKAALALETSEEKQRLMEQQMRGRKEYLKILKAQDKANKKQSKELEEKERQLQLKIEEGTHEIEEAKHIAQQLKAAKQAVDELRLAVLERKGENKQELLDDLQQLKDYLEVRYEE